MSYVHVATCTMYNKLTRHLPCTILPRVLWDRATNKSSIATVNAFPPENHSPTTSSDFAGENKEQEKDKDGSIKSTPMQLNAEVGESEIKW